MARHGTYQRKTPPGALIARWYCPAEPHHLQPAARLPGGAACPARCGWLRRRVLLVQQALRVVIGLLPQHLAGCRAELTACRQRLDSQAVLVALRSLAARSLPVLPAPLGFRPHRNEPCHPTSAAQQQVGPVARAPPPWDRWPSSELSAS